MSAPIHFDPVVPRELPMVRQLFRDETWLEGERRGYCVRADDPKVRDSVCAIILRLGAQMRAAINADIWRQSEREALKTREVERWNGVFGPPDFF